MRLDPTRFVFVRHGHTAANAHGGMVLSGWTDTPLSSEGVLEASLVARTLTQGLPFVALYTSPLQRAGDTARAVASALGIPVHIDADLREIFCGDVDGLTVDDVRSHHAAAWRRNAEEQDEDFRWPGGESYREFRARCLGALRRMHRRHPGGRVVAITHAGFISQVVGWSRGVSCAAWSRFRPANASLSTMDWRGHGSSVLSFDERSHLRAGAPARATPARLAG